MPVVYSMVLKWSRSGPGIPDLDINSCIVRPTSDVQTYVNPILSRDLVTKSCAASNDRLCAVESFEMIPCRPAANKTHETEALPELPPQLGVDLGDFLSLVAQRRRPSQANERSHVERFVSKTCQGVHPQAEEDFRA